MAKKPKDNSPVEIWLSPDCQCDRNETGRPNKVRGFRTWAEFEFPPCPVCGARPTRYVRPGLALKRKEK